MLSTSTAEEFLSVVCIVCINLPDSIANVLTCCYRERGKKIDWLRKSLGRERRGSSRIWCSYPGSLTVICFSLSTLRAPHHHVLQRSLVVDFATLGKPKRDPRIVLTFFASPSCYIGHFCSPSQQIHHLAVLLSQIEPASLPISSDIYSTDCTADLLPFPTSQWFSTA